MKTKINIRRVDIQVCIFTAIIIILSSACVYFFNYIITYQDMLNSLKERSLAIYHYVEDSLDKKTFEELNMKTDEQKESYQNTKTLLENVKSTTGVMYLYTAKKTKEGNLIYVVDGLDSDSPDFRHIGDPIEEEIWPELEYALKDNIILPRDIKKTNWGNIFIAYFPIHHDENVIGVIGIEFEANHQSAAFRKSRIITPLIAIGACMIAMLIAYQLFRRISNPMFQDFANTDQLTGLKNRNAFEVDMKNLENSTLIHTITLLSIDLNGLKKVNDTFGHQEGDCYIKRAATILQNSIGCHAVIYRTGGDEFIIMQFGEGASEICDHIAQFTKQNNENHTVSLSMAVGIASYDSSLDKSIYHTYQRADLEMYKNKRIMKKDKTE